MAQARSANDGKSYWRGMARGAAGAILFSLPMLMTMELWWLGFDASRWRLVLFAALALPMLVGLSHFSGMRRTRGWLGDVGDAVSAYGIGIAISAGVLFTFGVADLAVDNMNDLVGKIMIEAVPGAFGAVLAQSQMGQSEDGASADAKEQRQKHASYWGELFLMASGAIYLALSVAPTQEMVLIAYRMNALRAAVLALGSIALLHAFAYALQFKGQEARPSGVVWWSLLLRFAIAGYALALFLSAYLLWTFGRFAGTALPWILVQCVVLGFPASVGAAAARLLF
jgi:putative integral membrane protein (TIGR02587 family)